MFDLGATKTLLNSVYIIAVGKSCSSVNETLHWILTEKKLQKLAFDLGATKTLLNSVYMIAVGKSCSSVKETLHWILTEKKLQKYI